MAASYQTVAVLRLAPRLAKAEEHPPRGLGGLSGLLHGSMMTDAPAEALGFDAPGSILGLTRGGRARGVKSVPRGGAQAGDQRRSSSSSRLTSADGACRMRPVGVETDSVSPRSCSRPGLMSGVSTGSMVEGFVVSAPAVRARQHMGLHGLHPGNTGLPPPGSAVRPVGEGPGKTRGAKVTTSPASSESPPPGCAGSQDRARSDRCCHPWGTHGRTR